MEHTSLKPVKRWFDSIFSLFFLLATTPVFLAALLSMLIEAIFSPASRGPVFFADQRISRGKVFPLFKFRVFRKVIVEQALARDGYVDTKPLERHSANLTLTGRWLKKIYFDELPQLFNVLRGEMTLVGPRPVNLATYHRMSGEIKVLRDYFPAGLTGDFQARKGDPLSLGRDELDLRYAAFCRRSSGWRVAWYDTRVLFLTVFTVLRARGL